MWRLGPVVLLAVAPGCLSLSGDRPLPVQVVDAETKQPIRGAAVQIGDPVAPSPWSGRVSAATAGGDGVARLRVADAAGITLEVAALGYLSEEKTVPATAVQAVEPAHWFEATDRRPPAVVVELFAEPRPTVELVLPAGFRGRVRATVRPVDDAPAMPGQRQFAYEVPPSGEVAVVGPPVLRRTFAPDFRLRYADAAPLTQNARESEVGYWWLKTEGDVQVFLVGTKADYDAAVRAGEATPAGIPRSGGGPGGGKGGGRRGGGRRGGGGM
ncbi:MAG TPA: hypothetical protein VGF55_09090 [Gemmataceae bacterium]|jgi:hypothetical protein